MNRRFPGVTIWEFNQRSDGINAVIDGDITAFASDEILLFGELVRLNLDIDQFTVFPAEPLSCEIYGMILPGNDPQWTILVNGFLDNGGRSIWRNWFEKLAPNSLELINSEVCNNPNIN